MCVSVAERLRSITDTNFPAPRCPLETEILLVRAPWAFFPPVAVKCNAKASSINHCVPSPSQNYTLTIILSVRTIAD